MSRWKEFTHTVMYDGVAVRGEKIETFLDRLEDMGYEIKFVNKEGQVYTILARRK